MREKAADKEQKIQRYMLRYRLTTRQKAETHKLEEGRERQRAAWASGCAWSDTVAWGPLGWWNQGAESEDRDKWLLLEGGICVEVALKHMLICTYALGHWAVTWDVLSDLSCLFSFSVQHPLCLPLNKYFCCPVRQKQTEKVVNRLSALPWQSPWEIAWRFSQHGFVLQPNPFSNSLSRPRSFSSSLPAAELHVIILLESGNLPSQNSVTPLRVFEETAWINQGARQQLD